MTLRRAWWALGLCAALHAGCIIGSKPILPITEDSSVRGDDVYDPNGRNDASLDSGFATDAGPFVDRGGVFDVPPAKDTGGVTSDTGSTTMGPDATAPGDTAPFDAGSEFNDAGALDAGRADTGGIDAPPMDAPSDASTDVLDASDVPDADAGPRDATSDADAADAVTRDD